MDFARRTERVHIASDRKPVGDLSQNPISNIQYPISKTLAGLLVGPTVFQLGGFLNTKW